MSQGLSRGELHFIGAYTGTSAKLSKLIGFTPEQRAEALQFWKGPPPSKDGSEFGPEEEAILSRLLGLTR